MSFNPFPVVWADYRQNRLLVAVTLILIAVSVAVGIAVITLERSIRQGSARAADDFDLLIGAHGSSTQLVLSTVYLQLSAIPLLEGKTLAEVTQSKGVHYAAPIAFGDQYEGYPIIGTTAQMAGRDGKLKLTHGRMMLSRKEAVIGAAVDLPIGFELSPSHGASIPEEEGEDHHHEALHYKIVGKLAPRLNNWDSAIIVPIEDVWAVHEQPTGHDKNDKHIGPPWIDNQLPGSPVIAVKPDSVSSAYGLRNQFKTNHSQAVFPAEVLNELYSMMGDVRDMMSVMSVAAQILVLVAVLMTLLASFLARRRQFAILRAIGASRNYVFTVIWCEITLLIVSGTLAGIVMGIGVSHILAAVLEQKLGFHMPISIGMPEIRMVATLVVSGMFVALLPAHVGYKQSIASGLK